MEDMESPVAALGLAIDGSGDPSEPCIASGPLTGLQLALKSGLGAERSTTDAPPGILLARQRAVLAASRTMCSSLSTEGWVSQPLEGEWAPVEIIAHLRDVERDVNLPRLHAILAQDDPHLTAYDTDLWAEERSYISQDGPRVLEEYSQARMETIDLLAGLGPAAWNRPARHTLLGPTTLHELMKISTDHDWLHMAQLRETLKALEPQSAN